jgi:hypothetical protein
MQRNRACFRFVKVEQKFSLAANNQLRFLVGEFSAERCSISRRGTPMSVSEILRSAFDQAQIGSSNDPCQQSISQLGKDLQSGNLSAAQSDFASPPAAFSQPSTTTGASTTPATQSTASPIAQALNQLSSDLQSGNLSAAQKNSPPFSRIFRVVEERHRSTPTTLAAAITRAVRICWCRI